MKNILGNSKRTEPVLGDINELIKLADSYKEPIKIKEPKKKNIETKVNPVVPISGGLSFVTDENLYKEIIKYMDKEFPNSKNLISEKLKFEDNVMKGSNTYIATVVDMFLKEMNYEYRLATELDLEQNLKFTKDTYNDSGLALRNLTGGNKEEALYLFNQIKKEGKLESDFPMWFNLRGLKLDKNLNFNLTPESFYETAQCLNWESGTRFSKTNSFGFPIEKNENSNRQIWT
ncbi:MAG: hypothetical protein NUV46_04900, partial [Nanoarchaeota archaeon]|nr:hypothetical protein [Nanoarchaeota archaeon]